MSLVGAFSVIVKTDCCRWIVCSSSMNQPRPDSRHALPVAMWLLPAAGPLTDMYASIDSGQNEQYNNGGSVN